MFQQPLDHVIRFFWDGPMTSTRRDYIKSITANSQIKRIEMITTKNYRDYEVPEHPINPAFELLTAPHKSDYMRVYVTYYHGGGWADVKYCNWDWRPFFETLEQHPDKDGIGYREVVVTNNGYQHWPDDYYHSWCLGMAHFIFRPRSSIFKHYLNHAEIIINRSRDQLQQYPGIHPYLCSDNHTVKNIVPDQFKDYAYPLRWLEISEGFFPAQCTAIDRVMYGMPVYNSVVTGHNHRNAT